MMFTHCVCVWYSVWFRYTDPRLIITTYVRYIKHKEVILSNKVSFNNKKSKYRIEEAKSSLFLASTYLNIHTWAIPVFHNEAITAWVVTWSHVTRFSLAEGLEERTLVTSQTGIYIWGCPT